MTNLWHEITLLNTIGLTKEEYLLGRFPKRALEVIDDDLLNFMIDDIKKYGLMGPRKEKVEKDG